MPPARSRLPGTDAPSELVPAQRTPATTSGADVLRGLGLEALVELLETTSYGVCITGDDHSWTYLNPAAARMVGRPFEELQGSEYLLAFPEHERAGLVALEQQQREGDTGFYTSTLVRPDGTRREMTWSGTVIEVDGTQLAPAVFHDTTEVKGAQREAAALASTAAVVTGTASLPEALDQVAGAVVTATPALGCLVLVAVLPDDALRVLGRAGTALDGDGLAARLRLRDLPAADALAAGRPVLAAEVPALGGDGAAALVPVRWQGEVLGVVAALLPPGAGPLTEPEVALCGALADQAAVALAAHRLRSSVARASARLERERLARDLHDSVTHALFAVHQRAQLLERALERDDDALLRAAAQDLRPLAEQALAAMRRLVADRRDEPRLLPALREVAATVTARDGLPVHVDLPDGEPDCPDDVAAHLVHVAAEALHNAVKHAAARTALLALAPQAGQLVLTVSDDGRGFDPAAGAAGHGRRTMRERVELCGGRLEVRSAPGRGTRVVARVPLPG